MKNKFVILIVLIFIGFLFCPVQSADHCDIPPSPGSPGGDAGDDNASFNSFVLSDSVSDYDMNPIVGILKNGHSDTTDNLITFLHLGKFYLETNFNPSLVFEKIKIILIPSGGLFGIENDTTFKTILQEYVRLGGSIIVFGQQYGSHVDKVVPIPEGENLKSYGWREDNSCWSASSYLYTIHPAISSWVTFWTVLGSFITDGYIDTYPKNATVLLKRLGTDCKKVKS